MWWSEQCFLRDTVPNSYYTFYPRKLTPTEQKYESLDNELLAIKTAFEVWRPQLKGVWYSIQVYTNHKNFEYLCRAKALNQRQCQWALFFSCFNFIISYYLGTKNSRGTLHWSRGFAPWKLLHPQSCTQLLTKTSSPRYNQPQARGSNR